MSSRASLIRRHRWLPWVGLALVGVVAFVLWFFEPQALFIDDTVSETAPGVDAPDSSERGNGSAGAPADELAKGSFRPLGHDARGTAVVIDAADGNVYVRFVDFEVENGPDLKVYLSRAAADAPEGELAADIVDLGDLKGNVGDQNYLVPGSVDVGNYRSVVVWCKRFSVGFAVAPLDVRSS
jgi:hypothetical protein